MRKFREILAERAGFTLMELLVVMVILGLLAALVGPRIWKNVTKSKITTAKTQIELLGQALDQFRLDTGRYPSSSEGLEALRTNPGADGWDGPYLRKAVPMDPWKRPYSFQSPGSHGDYDLTTFGLDGSPGGTGENKDVSSWE
ncbi:MAG: type II secretion system major pseudopilin GspG [Thermodesulfovibrionales bacterium]|nr:type II secretion system major pseudopilin GspG [Thermodesulfovibrionales bacterium]